MNVWYKSFNFYFVDFDRNALETRNLDNSNNPSGQKLTALQKLENKQLHFSKNYVCYEPTRLAAK